MTKIEGAGDEKEGSAEPTTHVFVQTLNPMRGKMEWKPKPVDYDYKQEVARAAFADMLHDTERVSPAFGFMRGFADFLSFTSSERKVKKENTSGSQLQNPGLFSEFWASHRISKIVYRQSFQNL